MVEVVTLFADTLVRIIDMAANATHKLIVSFFKVLSLCFRVSRLDFGDSSLSSRTTHRDRRFLDVQFFQNITSAAKLVSNEEHVTNVD